ncbi:hypothetical protein ACIRVF_30375 [Kitasatospora sp. NPDC101157]
MIEIVERVIESYVEGVDYEDLDANALAERRQGVGAGGGGRH